MRKLKKLAPSSNLRLLSFRGTLQRLSVALLTLVMTLTAQTAWAETINGVSYIDENGATQTANNVTVLTGGEATTLQAGWYVVNSSNIEYTGTVTLNGDVNIILADGGKMNIETSGFVEDVKGIYGTNSTLIIYGQARGTGELNVETYSDNSDAILVDNLTINGGKITASASGSFSSVLSADKHITINGGIITATAGKFSLYGIFAADLTINGGVITATATRDGACGLRATNNLTINSGVITATANGEDGSGLSATNNITINSGVITATATGDGVSFGIQAEQVIIYGGQVTARGSNYGICSTYNKAGGIWLSWKNTTDFIDANSYYLVGFRPSLIIAAGKAFTDGSKNYTGAYTPEEASHINTKLSPVQAYSVAFDSNGGTSVSDTIVLDGATVTVPTAPTKEGKVFCGWYMDSDFQTIYDFTSAVTGQLTLYAKWADTSSNELLVQRIYRYTGSAVTPVVRNNAAKLLTAGTDYTVSYTGATEMKQPGVYTLTVEGQGSYTGSQTVSVRVLAFDKYNGTSLVSSTLPANNSNAVVVSSTTTAMQSGCWYVVSEDATVADRITVNGDVNLVLCDGATLTAEQGISVTDGNSLTIYSQSGNTGALVANVPKTINNVPAYHAAIGGDRYDTTNHTATTVNAGTITIHGGVINATAAYGAAGIGQAYGGEAGTINIYGGKITASGGTGIGGTGATVHLGWCRESDDFIESQGFRGTVVFDKKFALYGTNFGATLESIAGNKIVPTTKNFYTVTFQPNNDSQMDALCMLSGTTIPEPDIPFKAGRQFAGWYDNEGFSGSAYDFTTAVNCTFTLYAKWDNVAPISYIDADGHTVNDFTDYTPLENCYTELPEGTYFVGKNTTVSSRIELGGTVNLILGDGATLTAENGIHVAEYNTLNIFVQSAGTGALTASVANGTAIGAAIGADNSDSSIGLRQAGTIRIYGGIITANTGAFSNAIGGARGVGSGDIYIYGGTVTATAGELGLAIGSASYEGGTISILGGKITANNSYCIGGPNDRIHLGWQNADDFILSSKYRGTITIDKSFVLESNDAIEANINNIAGKKIVPNTTSFYDVSFNTNGGNVIESQHIRDGRSAVQPAAVKQHHTFDGWYANEGCTGSAYDFTTAVDHSFTLYAKWKANYRVNYSKAGIGGISGIMNSQTLHVGEANQLAACAYSRKGYTFIGWATTADGDAEYADGASVTSLTTTPGASVTLYAKWQANQYDISAPANFSVTVGGSTAATATTDQVVTVQAASGYSLINKPTVVDDNGMTRAVSYAGNGSYTFTMPASNVHIEGLVVESGWNFIGTYDTQNFSASNDDIYGFVGTAGTGTEVGSFVQVGGYVRVKPMRAYMQAPAPPNNARAYSGSSSDAAPAMLRIRLLGSNGETTGIVSLTPDPSPKGEGSGYWYTLDGRKLQGKPTQKGLYINNGKKVVIK